MMLPRKLLKAVVAAEGWWLDWRRRVRTGGYLHLNGLTLVGAAKQGYEYMPVRPRNARAALADLPLRNHAEFFFVDLGSGKGRMLFLAAEYPFRRIVGVEFARELHEAASQNIRRYRSPKQRCREIESVNMDAADYSFPNDPLVISLYNPFGPGVMRKVLDNLNASVAARPREVVLLLLYPESAAVVEADPHFRAYKKTFSYHIYQRR
jgi:predicted RNA methylase